MTMMLRLLSSSPQLAPRGGDQRSASFDKELIILPSEDLADVSSEEKLLTMWNQWNSMVGMLNKLGTNLQSLRCLVSEDVLLMDETVTRVEARVGETPQKEGFDDCGTVWEGLQLVNHTVKDTASTLSLS